MAVLDEPFSRLGDANGRPTMGTRSIYDENTSNLSTIYSDKALTITQTNPVPADAAGRLPVVHVAAATYKIIDKDAGGTIIDENDHYTVPDLSGLATISFPVVSKSADFTITSADDGKIFEVDATGGAVTVTMDSATNGNGMNAVVVKKDSSANSVILSAGGGQTFNGGASTYSLTQANQAAGVASQGAAGWRIWVLPAPTATPLKPQGRLTPTTGLPVLAADVTAATTVFYTAFDGQYVPIWDGTSWGVRQFAADLSLALDSNSGHTGYHQANKLFDVFLVDDNGTLRMGTGPAWTVSGNFVSAGTLTTGTAARSAPISRVNGVYVNTNSMTLRYGSVSGNTLTVAAAKGTYLGTIWTDATDGQLTCHVSYGQNRKWGVWNAYNRVPIIMSAGDSTANWTWNSSTYHAANAAPANSATVLCGLAEEWVDAQYQDRLRAPTNGTEYRIAIGIGSTSSASGGVQGYADPENAGTNYNPSLTARSLVAPLLGLQSLTALESVSTGTGTFEGTQAKMQLTVAYRG